MVIIRIFLLPLFVSFCVAACFRYDWDRDREVLEKEEVVCTPPARLEVHRWGKYGLFKSCVILSGPFVAAKDGYIHVRGQYEAWQEVGVWTFYDKDGNIVKTIDYSETD